MDVAALSRRPEEFAADDDQWERERVAIRYADIAKSSRTQFCP